jgi:hypothetical protein
MRSDRILLPDRTYFFGKALCASRLPNPVPGWVFHLQRRSYNAIGVNSKENYGKYMGLSPFHNN